MMKQTVSKSRFNLQAKKPLVVSHVELSDLRKTVIFYKQPFKPAIDLKKGATLLTADKKILAYPHVRSLW